MKFQVFKKTCPNGKITIYLPKRDYIETSTHVEPIEGVLVVDPNYVGARQVYVQLQMTFRYGCEEDEVMDVPLKRSLYIDTHQVYPPVKDINPSVTQANLANKLGSFAFPFILEIPPLAAPSTVMQRRLKQEGELMGMDYEVMAFVGHNDADIHARNSCKVSVRKLQDIPASLSSSKKPEGQMTKTMLIGMGPVTIHCTLGSRVVQPDETIPVTVTVKNDAKRDIKRLKVKLVQKIECPFFGKTKARARTIMKIDDKINLGYCGEISKNYTLLATPPPRRETGEFLLQGQFDSTAVDTLACSTVYNNGVNKDDVFGICVSYAVRVKATFGSLPEDVILDVPFTLKVPITN